MVIRSSRQEANYQTRRCIRLWPRPQRCDGRDLPEKPSPPQRKLQLLRAEKEHSVHDDAACKSSGPSRISETLTSLRLRHRIEHGRRNVVRETYPTDASAARAAW